MLYKVVISKLQTPSTDEDHELQFKGQEKVV